MSSSNPSRLLGQPPTGRQLARLPKSLPESQLVLVNKSIRQYFDIAGTDDEASGKAWLQKPELTTPEEILAADAPDDNVPLASNQIDGPWPSTEEYLETHYNFIREDAVAPLRDAVNRVRHNPHMKDDKSISIYEKVFITRITLAQRGPAFRMRFSTRRAGKKILWEYSNRLISGSVVALSPVQEKFAKKCVVAVVAARPLENVNKSPPEVDFFFAQPEDIDFDPQQEWLMVEARSGYFEAHRHSMTALQKLSKERFPLSEQICGLNPQIEIPKHVSDNPSMNLGLSSTSAEGGSSVNVLEAFPETPLGKLNVFQWNALKEILTKSLSIIQGPPGTGKTYVSVEALRILLSNMIPGDPPIIIATHTNHALDQLINLVAQFEPEFIRLGGRSTDDEIRKRSLHEIRQWLPSIAVSGGLLAPAREELRKLSSQINSLLKPFDKESRDGPLSSSVFARYGLLTPAQRDSLDNDDSEWLNFDDPQDEVKDPFVRWLGNEVRKFQVNYPADNFSFTEKEVDMEYEQLMELEAEQGQGSDEWDSIKGRTIDFEQTFHGRQSGLISDEAIMQYLKNDDLQTIHTNVRGAVYNFLRRQLVNTIREQLRELAKAYTTWTKKVSIGKWERDHDILRKAKLIGMTTAGLSKYRGLVSSLNPRIVMIEEAAEVLEAPVTAACFESLQQLILVGDHKQLKGHSALHDLAGKPFYLDVSMFERLVRNNMPFVQLREQRRMAPEIRRLLTPIYGDLYDHPSVQGYPSIPGMGEKRSWFFTHHWPESGDSLSSKTNELEAVMIVEFYVYLILNGVDPGRITALTFYNGQKKLLLRNMRSNSYLANQMPKVLTVDSYQGEENDIVLLSLVRSNHSGGIGFVAVDNRACVALSRAKHGFFIFGNAANFAKNSRLWHDVVSLMAKDSEQVRLGSFLPLTCSRHSRQMLIKDLTGWSKVNVNGGCERECGETLKCGHTCSLSCHGLDHSRVACQHPCLHVQPRCGHACTHTCGPRHAHTCQCTERTQRRQAPAKKQINQDGLLIDFEDPEPEQTSLVQGPASNVRSTVEAWRNLANTGEAGSFQEALERFQQASLSQERREPVKVKETFRTVMSKSDPPTGGPAASPPRSLAQDASKESPNLLNLDYDDDGDASSDEDVPLTGHLLDLD